MAFKIESLFALVLCLTRVVPISSKGKICHVENLTGVFLALFSAALWSGYWIINIKDRRNESVKLFLNFLFGLIFIILYGLFFADFWLPSLRGLFGAAYVGFFEMGITFFLWSKALSMAESTASINPFPTCLPSCPCCLSPLF